MAKKPSPYEQKNGYFDHEQAMEPILKTLVYISEFTKNLNAESRKMHVTMIDPELLAEARRLAPKARIILYADLLARARLAKAA